jgi:hypothetical protein
VTSRYRIYAAVGLAGVVVLGLGFLVLGRGQNASSAPAPAIKPLHPVAKKMRTKAQAVATKTPSKKQSMVPTAVRKARKTTKVTDGMPVDVSAALVKHDVVVVSLVSPGASVDELAYQEAKAGAHEAGAGFVRVSAANNADVQALSTLVGASASPDDRLLDSPAVLVLRQPHELFVRFNGFVDAATVAQAATNASPVVQVQNGASALADPWVTGANAVCREISKEEVAAPLPTSTAEYVPYIKKLLAIAQAGVARIRTLKPPPGKAAAVRSMLDHYDLMFADANGIIAAAEKGNLAEIRALSPKLQAEEAAGDQIAAQLGANDCGNSQG